MKTRAPLKWKRESPTSIWAWRGGHIIGTIGQMQVDESNPRHGLFHWSISSVHTRWITKGYGDSKTEKAAQRALTRAWNGWLKEYGLVGEEIVLD